MKRDIFQHTPSEDQIIGDFIRQRGNEHLRRRYRNLLSRDHNRPRPPAPDRGARAMVRRVLPWAAAAAALAGLILGVYHWTGPGSRAGGELLASYLDVADYYVPLTRSSAAVRPVDKRDVDLLLDFGAKRFDRVIAREGEHLQPTGRFYLALALITTGRYGEAQLQLERLRDDPHYAAEANWYHTLLLLRSGSVGVAETRLRAYQPADVLYYGRARTLLDELAN